MRVITAQLAGEIARLVIHFGLRDGGDTQVFNEHMRRFQDQSAHSIGILAGKDQRDRPPSLCPSGIGCSTFNFPSNSGSTTSPS